MARQLAAAALAAGVLAGHAAAQGAAPRCQGTFTVEQCFRFELGEFSGTEAVSEEVQKATTGAQTANEAVTTAVRDFLPRVGAALLLPGVDEDRTGLALRLNRRLGPVSGQIGVDLNDPVLFAPLVDSIPESIRAASKERLEAELEDQDDVTLSVAFNLESAGWGRSFAPHRGEISNLVRDLTAVPASLQQALFNAIPSAMIVAMEEARLEEKKSLPACDANLQVSEVQLLCLRETFADSVRDVLRGLAVPYREISERRAAALGTPAFAAIAQLLNNQPQINGTVKYRHRDDLVGPNELTFTGRWEMGRYNLNWLRGQCRGSITAACLVNEMTEENLQGLSRGARGWVSVDGTWRDEHELVLAADSVDIREAGAWEVKFQAGYGQYFGAMREEGTRRPRIDFDVGYVLSREDLLRNDRATASLSYTHPFSSTSAGVFGVRWASKPEFLGDVDRNLSATLGLTYKLVNDDDK
jgi:hypothetical protein